ncbi:2-octaprenyl-6-methoxyphenyl hydroxylase [Providencia sp. CRE-3FA-0001]|uniref:2-octaprenyl-6-methoxyphenyl hydroxylase n=1 Tax=Providencia huashanensis TaxID=3037798 RepID=A0AA42JZZ4_9GAMM|nr:MULTISPECIES: 2-octaprenyl-6-methoxyphenyl hydroxylase [Providencia]EJD6409343.1 2-octaprenyl-6-methoxyphenyl hydroxylase [Providencia rettgeri]EJD6661638.1 2-octaprenyl-6-methoxyphenyl hydroxylase [Providencia rettgeri]ELR5076911.1 2-octaprenyl-6-methoxyphenyl hydroxylase [Providencia rettgeri]ELR5173175.1 2-octaprenyl-6-methoxyphenyl hydroxylase [Providencia rettgeri]ELR5195754.1 2-octaprenyl-6-methoxyphenyl hydroxylase [Providencia rettgeri]
MNVIIVGGGMAGATLALAISSLSQGKLSVSLIEAALPEGKHPGFDARAIALAHGTCQYLSKIGVWPAFSDCVTPINHVHVSDRGHAGFVNIAAKDYHIAALGNVIELHEAGTRLFSLLRKAPGVTLYCPAKVESVHREQGSVSVTLDNGDTVTGQLLVAADGSHSAIGKACNIQWQQDDYGQVAIIANVKMAVDPKGQAFERFTEFGPLALLPMSQGRSSLVWCHHQEQADAINAWDDATFIHRLQQAFGWRLGEVVMAGKRHCYPLVLRKALTPVSHRVVLVGNAAQTLHPIAGQGFNLGLRDVMQLAQTVVNAHADNQDIGSYSLLSQYQQIRALDRDKTVTMTDGLVRIFANRCLPLIVGRNLGLMAMEMLPPARDVLARQTLGWVTHQ